MKSSDTNIYKNNDNAPPGDETSLEMVTQTEEDRLQSQERNSADDSSARYNTSNKNMRIHNSNNMKNNINGKAGMNSKRCMHGSRSSSNVRVDTGGLTCTTTSFNQVAGDSARLTILWVIFIITKKILLILMVLIQILVVLIILVVLPQLELVQSVEYHSKQVLYSNNKNMILILMMVMIYLISND